MSNKFWKGMLWGAVAGGVLSLLDRETRYAMKKNCQKASRIINNPEQITNHVKETVMKVRTTVEQVSEDLSYISGKVEELRETTPQVAKILKETRDVFSKHHVQEKDVDRKEELEL